MKKILLSAVAILSFGGMAAAADLPAKVAAPVVQAPPCAQFGGFYVGGNVGGVSYTAHRNDDDGYFVDNSGHTLTKSGWAAGVQGGYNWQRRCTVFGVEADWNWGSAKVTFQDDPNAGFELNQLESKLRWFGTARTRAGVIVDDLLIYATGGFAWANVENTYTRACSAFNCGVAINENNAFSSTRWGWTVGAGTEWKFAPNWSLKSEALYVQLKEQQDTFTVSDPFPPPSTATFRWTNNDNFWVARVGVNYIFGGGIR
jgi:outer membrane immunogenic protein